MTTYGGVQTRDLRQYGQGQIGTPSKAEILTSNIVQIAYIFLTLNIWYKYCLNLCVYAFKKDLPEVDRLAVTYKLKQLINGYIVR